MKMYGPEIREPLVRRMMSPENASVLELSRETEISRYTLHDWRRKARKTMGARIPGNGKRPVARSIEKEKRIIARSGHPPREGQEIFGMPGIFCRFSAIFPE